MAPDRYHQIVNSLNSFPGIRGLGISASVVAVIVVGFANIVADLTPSPGVPLEHLTLEGAMLVAVGVLWRALQAERAQVIESTRAVTAALAAQSASNAELRKIIEHLNDSLSIARSVR